MKTKHSIAAAALLAALAAVCFLFLRHRRSSTVSESHEYVDPATCAQCHDREASGYARTGMAHAFSTPNAADTVESPAKNRQFYHAASGTYYELTQRDGKYYQRRWQKGFEGNPDNVEELKIDAIMGSGNHVRTYLHREPEGTLIELPLAW